MNKLHVVRKKLEIGGQVLAIVTDERTGRCRVHKTHNIVTDAGDIWYAQKGASETPTNAFTQMELGTAGTPGKAATTSSFTLIASTAKTVKATYPKTADADTDNTGDSADTVTWTFEWAAADFNNGAITHGWIVVAGHGAGAAILTGFAFAASFAKAATDTLKVIVNHTVNGV